MRKKRKSDHKDDRKLTLRISTKLDERMKKLLDDDKKKIKYPTKSLLIRVALDKLLDEEGF